MIRGAFKTTGKIMNLIKSQHSFKSAVIDRVIGNYKSRRNAIYALAAKLEKEQARLEILLETAIAQPIMPVHKKWHNTKVYVIEQWEHNRVLVTNKNQNTETFDKEELFFTGKELLQVDNYLTLAILQYGLENNSSINDNPFTLFEVSKKS